MIASRFGAPMLIDADGDYAHEFWEEDKVRLEQLADVRRTRRNGYGLDVFASVQLWA